MQVFQNRETRSKNGTHIQLYPLPHKQEKSCGIEDLFVGNMSANSHIKDQFGNPYISIGKITAI